MEILFLLVVSTMITFRVRSNSSHTPFEITGCIGPPIVFVTILAFQTLIPVEQTHLKKIAYDLACTKKNYMVHAKLKLGDLKCPKKVKRLFLLIWIVVNIWKKKQLSTSLHLECRYSIWRCFPYYSFNYWQIFHRTSTKLFRITNQFFQNTIKNLGGGYCKINCSM